MESLKLNTTYSILFKLGFHKKVNLFFIFGSQIGIVILVYHNQQYYKNIFRISQDIIVDIMIEYNIEYILDTVSIYIK
jgi:hypothetical protein